MNQHLFIKSAVISSSDKDRLAGFGLESIDINKQLIPANLRRRTSLTTKLAVTVATEACRQANLNPAELPSLFASVGGEIQVTDALCRDLPDKQLALSPTQFHNSVHNTSAGYWGILHQCQHSTTAIAAVDDTFAMGLLEAWSQLQQLPGNLLLVCYDEYWPDYLSPPMGKVAMATALILSNVDSNNQILTVTQPEMNQQPLSLSESLISYLNAVPAAAVIPLLQAIKNSSEPALIPLNVKQPLWSTQIIHPN